MAAIPRELLKNVRRIHLRTKKLVDSLLSGAYKSAFKGRGIEFMEVREFQVGDEMRHIDWNVTARMGTPYVKNFHEERQLTIMLMVDMSGSSLFGSTQRSKNELMAEIAATLALSAIENDDRVGLILYSNGIDKYIPPKNGLRHVLRVIREILVNRPEHKETHLENALSFLGSIQKHSCACFIISDFLTTGYDKALKLASKHFDLIGVRVTDPREWELPDVNLLQLRDLETGDSVLVDTSDARVQKHFREKNDEQNRNTQKLFGRLGLALIDLKTDEPYAPPIERFFRSRQRVRH